MCPRRSVASTHAQRQKPCLFFTYTFCRRARCNLKAKVCDYCTVNMTQDCWAICLQVRHTARQVHAFCMIASWSGASKLQKKVFLKFVLTASSCKILSSEKLHLSRKNLSSVLSFGRCDWPPVLACNHSQTVLHSNMVMSMMMRFGALPAKLAGTTPFPSQSQRCSTIVRAEGEKVSKSDDQPKSIAKVQHYGWQCR
jgi:hypothetical protein